MFLYLVASVSFISLSVFALACESFGVVSEKCFDLNKSLLDMNHFNMPQSHSDVLGPGKGLGILKD